MRPGQLYYAFVTAIISSSSGNIPTVSTTSFSLLPPPSPLSALPPFHSPTTTTTPRHQVRVVIYTQFPAYHLRVL